MQNLFEIILGTILNHNIALVYILGMCPLIAISTNVKNAKGMGIAVVFVVTITGIINWPIYSLLKATGTTNLALLVFIITIAAAESAVGLSILVNFYRNFGSTKTQTANTLKG